MSLLAFTQNPTLVLVFTTALVLTIGAAGQVLSRKVPVPSILLLLGAGIALGPAGLGLIRPEVFGGGLRALISIAVAIIVFEGALMIDVRALRHCSRSVVGLITVGAGTTFLLAAVISHFLVGLPWKIAFLFGAIVSVTGPTVVTPILKRLPLTRRLKTTLEAEAVFVDALGVLLTAAVFAFITGSDESLAGGVVHLLVNLASGAVIGALGAGALKVVIAGRLAPSADLVRPIALAGVLLTYSVAEALAHESGIAAVAVAGLITGSLKLPHEAAIKQFKSDLTHIALSLVFILLAGSISLPSLVGLGWGGVATVLLLMVVVRPLSVALSTWGTSLSFGERAFIAWLAPRGIVAASMASLMAIELKAWNVQGAEPIAPLVFLTIILTVLIEGSGAGWAARRLNVMPKKIVIAGGDEIARRLAHQLTEDGETVTLIDLDPENVRLALHDGLHAVDGDASDPDTLAAAGAGWCQALVVATPSDKANLLIGQAAKARFPDLRVVARVNDGRHLPTFRQGGLETMTLAEAAATSLSVLVTRPNTLPLLGMTSHPDKIVEVQVGNQRYERRPLKSLDLPDDCLIALVKRDGRVAVADGGTELMRGDLVTLIGQRESVEQLRTLLESDV